jgi:hypothetical protein
VVDVQSRGIVPGHPGARVRSHIRPRSSVPAYPQQVGVIEAAHRFGGKDAAQQFTFADPGAMPDDGRRQALIAGRGEPAVDLPRLRETYPAPTRATSTAGGFRRITGIVERS